MKVWSFDLEPVGQTTRFFGSNCWLQIGSIGCKFGSGIGLPYQMVSLAQTISRFTATVLLSIHGVGVGHTNRSNPDH